MVSTELEIRNLLARYVLYIDTKQHHKLAETFTEDAVAYYGEYMGELKGLSAIQAGIKSSTEKVTSHHTLSTQIIDLKGEGLAETISFFTANNFGTGTKEGKVLTAFGRYEDKLRKTDDGWRIYDRKLVFMGPLIGDTAVFVD